MPFPGHGDPWHATDLQGCPRSQRPSTSRGHSTGRDAVLQSRSVPAERPRGAPAWGKAPVVSATSSGHF